MRVLIAEDDRTSKRILEAFLTKWGYEVIAVDNGKDAWEILQHKNAPHLAVLDWMMPEMDGTEVCRKVRGNGDRAYTYILLLTAKGQKEDVVDGILAGADDYLVKPFDRNELHARVNIGRRIIELQSSLAARVEELQDALDHIQTLQGILPICMYCHKIRADHESWDRLEKYIMEHSEAQFSHGICPECMEEHHPGLSKENRQEQGR